MLRRLAVFVVCVGVPLSFGAPSPTMAVPAATAPNSQSRIEGWSGADPSVLALQATVSGGAVVAFTTADAEAGSVWVSDRSGGGWGTPVEVATGLDPATVDFAANRAGAAVMGWDAVAEDGRTHLHVSARPSATGAWSAPAVLASDESAGHSPQVGIDGNGAVTVGYLHEADVGRAAYTRRYVGGAWTEPLRHSTEVADQLRLEVAANGTVALVWSEEDPEFDPEWHAGQPGNPIRLQQRQYDSATGTWSTPLISHGAKARDGLVDLAINDDGITAVASYRYDMGGRYALSVARNLPDRPSAWIGSTITAYDFGQPPASLEVNDRGDALVALTKEDEGGVPTVRLEQSNGSFWEGLDLSQPGAVSDPRIFLASGLRAVVTWVSHDDDGDVLHLRRMVAATPHSRLDPVVPDLGGVSAEGAAAFLDSGDVVVLWPGGSAGSEVLRSQVVSATEIIRPGRAFNDSLRVPVRWRDSDVDGGSYDVRTRQATPKRGFGSRTTWQNGTVKTSATFRAAGGRTVCFSTRARNGPDHRGVWSAEGCTAVALDDRALTRRGWERRSPSAAYRDTVLTSTRRGARLTLSQARARSVALLVNRNRHSGVVRVTLGSRNLGKVDLRGAPGTRVVVPVRQFADVRRGRLTLTVVSSGRRVSIDGIFVSAR